MGSGFSDHHVCIHTPPNNPRTTRTHALVPPAVGRDGEGVEACGEELGGLRAAGGEAEAGDLCLSCVVCMYIKCVCFVVVWFCPKEGGGWWWWCALGWVGRWVYRQMGEGGKGNVLFHPPSPPPRLALSPSPKNKKHLTRGGTPVRGGGSRLSGKRSSTL